MEKKWEIVKYAYEKVLFYMDLAKRSGVDINQLIEKKDWYSLPFLSREEAAYNNSQLIASEYMGLYAMDKLIHAHTSGSSGEQLEVYWAEKDYYMSLLPLWIQRWKAAKIHPKDKVCFLNSCLPDGEDYRVEKSVMFISKSKLDYDRMSHIGELIQEFRPRWLLLHPSAANLLCEVVVNENIDLHFLEYVELTGEMYFEQLVKRIERLFSCTVKGHYGSMEMSSIGYELEHNRYEIFETSVYVEVLNEDGQPAPLGEIGEIYVTSLQNYAMPFIRYCVGDRGKFLKNSTGKRVLEICGARNTEYLITENGERLNAELLLEPIIRLSMGGEKMVYQVQSQQTDERELIILVVLDDEIERNEFIQYYLNNLDRHVSENFNIIFKFIDRVIFPNTDTGKVKWFTKLSK